MTDAAAPDSPWTVRIATPDDAPAMAELIGRGIRESIAPQWEPSAVEALLAATTADTLAALLTPTGYAALALAVDAPVRVIVLPQPQLLSHLFVATAMQHRGMARALWEGARSHLERAHPQTRTVELNAAPAAVAVYEALGFHPISGCFRRHGAVAVRMGCWLPERSLAAAAQRGDGLPA